MTKPIVSVIVPIYNTKEYLISCLDSILSQTYPALQVILVDDGSTDGSGGICDEYAQKDPRVQVIHQKNRGVSAARNAGLEAATGDWIGWVDSDDWIEADMVSVLLEKAISVQADICVCGRFEELPSRTLRFGWSREQLLDGKAAMKALLQERYMDNALYDKLWRRELFQHIRFPEGATYEDLAVVWRLFERAKRVHCLPQPKYHYRHRAWSIVADTSLDNRLNHYKAARRRLENMGERWPEFQELLEQRCITAALGIWCGYNQNPRPVRKKYATTLREIAEFSKPRIKKAKKDSPCGLAGGLVMGLLPYDRWWAFALAGLIGRLYQWKHGRML